MSKAPMFEESDEFGTAIEHHAEASEQGRIDCKLTKTIQANVGEVTARTLQHGKIPCYMYKVPWCLKDPENNRCFIPRLVSIGPYHHTEPHLKGMQFHKYRVLALVLKRTGKDLIGVIKALEDEARASYQDLPNNSFTREEFLEMLLLDACFVLEFLVGRYEKHHTDLGYEDSDPIFTKLYMYCGIDWDMILLENQIPLFILNKLYEAIHGVTSHGNHVVKLMVSAFNRSWVMGRTIPMPDNLFSSLTDRGDGLSCMEIFWRNLVYEYDRSNDQYVTIALSGKMEERPNTKDLEKHIIPCVTALDNAGVVFKFKNTVPFWDIDFKGGVLKIPQIMIHEASESIFLNLMAYEHYHVNAGGCKIIKYILFMDSLVNSASDMAQLRAHGIIVCAGRSDDEIKNMFSRLGKRAYIPFNQFEILSEQINKYCHRKRNLYRAMFFRDYFNSPWASFSVAGAVLLLVAAICETIYTALKYYQKH